MKRISLLLVIFSCLFVTQCKRDGLYAKPADAAPKAKQGKQKSSATHLPKHLQKVDFDKVDWTKKSKKYWKQVLSPLTYYVTRKHGTERPFTGKLLHNKHKGVYICSNCGHRLFHSRTKFKSGTGWPSFYDVYNNKALKKTRDSSLGMVRVEVSCKRCGAHLGHVFPDGPKPTGLRYCINSVSIGFLPHNHPKAKTP